MSQAQVFVRQARTILTPTGGYLEAYTHTLQPYSGCEFSCAYCYVREMTVQRTQPHKLPWSKWIAPKRNAPELLHALALRGRLAAARIFCSSVSDPYTPLERKLGLTRGCLEVLAASPPAALVVQTRSPLVERDAALLASIPSVVVSLSITTDDEGVRQAFEPNAPGIGVRIETLRALRRAGVRTQVAVAPLLPCDPGRLAALLDPVADRIVVDDFFQGDGAGGRRSRSALAKLRDLGHPEWAEPGYAERAIESLRRTLGAERVLVSRAGFNELRWVSGESAHTDGH